MTFSKVAENHKALIREIIDYAYTISAIDAVGVKIADRDLEGLALNVLIQCYQNGFYVTNEEGEHVISDVLQAVTIEALRSENGSFDRFTVKLETTKGPWEIDAWRVSYGDHGFLGSINGIYSES
tara:strand:+ start:321 stop:695 length:375 start_codon:yes stop_codon:yes gene_type:complete